MQDKKKRGQEHQEVVLWTIGLAGLLVFGVFIYMLYAKTPAVLDKETCRESVAKRGLWVINGLPDDVKPELQCKTQQIKISSTDTNVIKKEIANSMYDCWDMLGRGKVDLFAFTSGPMSEGPPKRCIICSTIQFNEKVQEKVPKVDGILSYMYRTKIPRKSITYYEFLKNEKGSDSGFNSQLDVATSLETKESYAIMFIAARDLASFHDFFNVYGTQVGGGVAGGAALGFVIGLAGGPIGAGAGAIIGGTIAAISGWIESLIEGNEAGCPGEIGCYGLFLLPYNQREVSACDTLESLP